MTLFPIASFDSNIFLVQIQRENQRRFFYNIWIVMAFKQHSGLRCVKTQHNRQYPKEITYYICLKLCISRYTENSITAGCLQYICCFYHKYITTKSYCCIFPSLFQSLWLYLQLTFYILIAENSWAVLCSCSVKVRLKWTLIVKRFFE